MDEERKDGEERREAEGATPASAPASFLWPMLMAASASGAAASFMRSLAEGWGGRPRAEPCGTAPGWASDNAVTLELPTMQLRDFSRATHGQAALICAPLALHGATVADLAQGHSVIEALHRYGQQRLWVTDWRSATPVMQHYCIDHYLAELNVAVDEIGPPLDVIGLCQGGWMALVYAARFPHKVRRLVLAGAPVDIRAGESGLSRTAAQTPFSAFEALVRLGEGRVLGRHMLDLWSPTLVATKADTVLQVPLAEDAPLRRYFDSWNAWTVDLPGRYYLEVVQHLYKQNRIAAGGFVALGRAIDLSSVRAPLFLLAGRDDTLVHPEQLFATARLVGTRKDWIETALEPCGHLSLFLGAQSLNGIWRRIADWLARDLS